MKRRHQLTTAVLLAILAITLAAGSALAHASEDPSLAHQILDSAMIPVLGVAALAVVTLSWWRVRDNHQQ